MNVIGKDLEGSGPDIIKVLSQNINGLKKASPADIRTDNLPSASLERHCSNNLLGITDIHILLK
jgi:hypothetical protein